MTSIRIFVAIALSCVLSASFAQLDPYEDYSISEKVQAMTTVQVKANMIDDYLEGIQRTWVAGQELAKELGHIEDYAIYVSDLPQSGDFNVVLITTYASTSDLGPSQERYQEFMKQWGEQREQQSREISKDYPSMRNITGEYRLREIKMK